MSNDQSPSGPPVPWSRKQMEKAFAHHQAGRLSEAEKYYRQVLRLEPDEPDANNLLGVLLFQSKRASEGLAYLDKATRLKPNEAMFFFNYGTALKASGKLQPAMQAFARSVELDPSNTGALSPLGDLLLRHKRYSEAVGVLKRLTAAQSGDANAHKKLAEAFSGNNQKAEAAQSYRRAVELKPGDPALSHHLGLCLQAQEDKAGAMAAYRKCIELKPEMAAAHNNLAILLADANETEQAVKHYELAIEHDANLFQTRCNLGGLLRKLGRLDDSITCLEAAVEARPDCAEAWCNLGNSLGDAGKPERAMECYRKSLLCKPDYSQARLNRSLGLLRLEDFEQGWMEYEWRSKLKECPRRHTSKPRWNGKIAKDARVLVHCEQGLGDTIQMCRYTKWMRQQGMQVILECQKPLPPLMEINEVASEIFKLSEKPPAFDVQIPLMSLPSVLWSEVGFCGEPYLRPAPERIAKWQERLSGDSRPKVAIAWQGNPSFKQDLFRSIALDQFEPLFEATDADFISLQKMHGTEQLADFKFSDRVQVFDDLDAEGGAFMDTAALMTEVDVVVTSDSAVAHLAGALGVKTLLLLPYAADWRWFADRTNCPWYPTMKLFRQPQRNDWPAVFAQVAGELQAILQEDRQPASS